VLTLLRIIHAGPDPASSGPVRVLASMTSPCAAATFYGTVLIDITTSRPVGVAPAESLIHARPAGMLVRVEAPARTLTVPDQEPWPAPGVLRVLTRIRAAWVTQDAVGCVVAFGMRIGRRDRTFFPTNWRSSTAIW
jgi:hypothetical protein